MAPQSQDYLRVAKEAALAAGAVIAKNFSAPKNVVHKGTVDLVTETDQQCEKLVYDIISAAFPDHKFIGEEESASQGFTASLTDAPTWMVDPLDGTTNFVHSYPFVCVCIGLVINQEVVVGVVYNPILNELFTACKGEGAFLNGTPIQVSNQSDLQKALVATEIGTTRDAETVEAVFDRVKNLTSVSQSVRCCGSCAMNLCGVACGRLDAFYEIGFGGCWDVAAAAVVLQEAGGQVLDPAGGPFDLMGRRVLGANAHLGRNVAAVLAASKLSSKEPPVPVGVADP
jgi:inositol-phosphate phosphatase / L-galactose 1-phosphate phosphatase